MILPHMEFHCYLKDIRRLVTFPTLDTDQDKINTLSHFTGLLWRLTFSYHNLLKSIIGILLFHLFHKCSNIFRTSRVKQSKLLVNVLPMRCYRYLCYLENKDYPIFLNSQQLITQHYWMWNRWLLFFDDKRCISSLNSNLHLSKKTL